MGGKGRLKSTGGTSGFWIRASCCRDHVGIQYHQQISITPTVLQGTALKNNTTMMNTLTFSVSVFDMAVEAEAVSTNHVAAHHHHPLSPAFSQCR